MINIVTEPRVYLVAQMYDNPDELAVYLHSIGTDWQPENFEHPTEVLPEIAGRVCYNSFNNPRPGGNKAYLDHIKAVGHGSVTEAAVYSFIFADISRSTSHELVRHRTKSYSQRSQRFIDESGDIKFVLPHAILEEYQLFLQPVFAADEKSLRVYRERCKKFYLWRDSCEISLSFYKQLLGELERSIIPEGMGKTDAKKWARQAAREVLPNCTATTVYVTANARSWRNFLELRASRHADVAIRKVANAAFDKLLAASPNLFDDYARVPLSDGTFELTTPYRKI